MVNGWNFDRGKPLLQKTGLRGEIVGGVVEGEYYMMLPDWAKRKGEFTNLKKIHWSQLYSI